MILNVPPTTYIFFYYCFFFKKKQRLIWSRYFFLKKKKIRLSHIWYIHLAPKLWHSHLRSHFFFWATHLFILFNLFPSSKPSKVHILAFQCYTKNLQKLHILAFLMLSSWIFMLLEIEAHLMRLRPIYMFIKFWGHIYNLFVN